MSHPTPHGFYAHTLKRLLDVGVASAALVISSPVIAALCVVTSLADRGPALYRSTRLGRDQQPFTMFKIRTMVANAADVRNDDGSTYSGADDPRVTPFGRWLRRTSLDELPQLINVLRGDMSLVGPRPSPLGNQATYDALALRRFEVRPGITGLAQSTLRNSGTLVERYELDAHYVDHCSLGLDLTVIVRTIGRVFSGSDVMRNAS